MKSNKPKSKGSKPKGNGNRKPKTSRDVNTKWEGNSITKDEDVRPITKGDNDAAWYGVSGQMVKDTASLSFNNPIGYPLDMGSSEHFTDEGNGPDITIPGIMAFNTCMGPGVSTNNNSAVNLAAKNIYTFVRHVNSGASNYEPADLMLYILALDSAYAWYTHLIRAYGVSRTYKQSNRYYPDVLLLSMGFNPKSIKYDLPRFRSIINTFVRKIGSRPIPGNLNILKRHTWMFSNVFKDAESNKAQMYLFKPRGFHFYDEYSGAGRLKWVQYQWMTSEAGGKQEANEVLTLDDIEKICDHMSNLILGSEDLGIISGDIVKAYGQNVFQLSEIHEDFFIEPIHSEEVLTQMHNMLMVGDPLLDSMHIKQTTGTDVGAGALIWAPESYTYTTNVDSSTAAWHAGRNVAFTEVNRMIDLPYSEPTPDDVMVATRLSARFTLDRTGSLTPDSTKRYLPISCGSEFISGLEVWSVTRDGSGFHKWTMDGSYVLGSSPNTSLPRATIMNMCVFDWHPIVYLWQRPSDAAVSATKWDGIDIFGDIDNVTTYSPSLAKRMDNSAILSLWDVPETAFYKG